MDIQVKDVKSIGSIMGTGRPGSLSYMEVHLHEGKTVTLYMLDANELYQRILQEQPEIIQEWRDRTGIHDIF